MERNRPQSLLLLTLRYKVNYTDLIYLLKLYDFETTDLIPTSIATVEMIHLVRLYTDIARKRGLVKNNAAIEPYAIGKIDLGNIKDKTKIESDKENKDTIQKPKMDNSEEEVDFLIENIRADKLSGPKILGKIDLASNSNKRERTKIYSHTNHEKRKPEKETVWAIGKLSFFDYKKNHFGVVNEIVTEDKFKISFAKVFIDGLRLHRNFRDGELVYFKVTFTRDHKHRYTLTELDSVDIIDFSAALKLIAVIDFFNLKKVIDRRLSNTDQPMTSVEKELIFGRLLESEDIFAWSALVSLNDELKIDEYLAEIVTGLSEERKILFLNEGFHSKLLQKIVDEWNTSQKDIFINLFRIVKAKAINGFMLSVNFIDTLYEIDLNFGQIFELYNLSGDSKLRSILIEKFSFSETGAVSIFLSLNEKLKFTKEELYKIRLKLNSEYSFCSSDIIFSIYHDLSEFKFIKEPSILLDYLDFKNLDYNQLLVLVKCLPNDTDESKLRLVVNGLNSRVNNYEVYELLEACVDKDSLIDIIVSDRVVRNDGGINCNFLIDYLLIGRNDKLERRFFEKYYKALSSSDSIKCLELALSYKVLEAQKYSFKMMTKSDKYDFLSEKDVLDVIKKMRSLKVPANIKVSNRPFADFIRIFNSDANIDFSDSVKVFLQENSGAVQCLLVKYLIFQYSNKQFSKTVLTSMLNSFAWTEISALLIIEFIKESSYTEKYLTQKLDVVFKNHFNSLRSLDFDKMTFFKNFKIGNIISSCNGRKTYHGGMWQGKRWYFEDGNPTYSTNDTDSRDFFCEGRPWKKEKAWDSSLNKVTENEMDFYWCKSAYCASRNDNSDISKPYHEWTISEISNVIGIQVEKLALAYLAGWANRMNQIVEHLVCRSCNEILRPLPFVPKTLGYYAVPIFQCVNARCSENGKNIRFTHCLNGKCQSHKKSEPLDSRDCISCRPNDPKHIGLKCRFCGQSCPSCSRDNYQPIVVQDIF